jgi:hypothetical protein
MENNGPDLIRRPAAATCGSNHNAYRPEGTASAVKWQSKSREFLKVYIKGFLSETRRAGGCSALSEKGPLFHLSAHADIIPAELGYNRARTILQSRRYSAAGKIPGLRRGLPATGTVLLAVHKQLELRTGLELDIRTARAEGDCHAYRSADCSAFSSPGSASNSASYYSACGTQPEDA